MKENVISPIIDIVVLRKNNGMNDAQSILVFFLRDKFAFILFSGANLLWNNMLEPVGNKTEKGLPAILEKINCPTENAPYIFTNINSQRFRTTGRQDGILSNNSN